MSGAHKDDEPHDVEALDESAEFDESETVTFVDEDGKEHECVVLAVVEVEGKDYAMLAEASQLDDENDEGEVETYLFEYSVDEEGFEQFGFIEDEDRYKAVQEVCATLMAEGGETEE